MLVCNVSMRPSRRAITTAIVETTTAVDATATGNVVFATLVDDPASVGEIVDAYLGEIMVEAANASDTVSAGSAYVAAVDEAVTAADVQDGTIVGAAVAREAMIAGPLPVFVNSGTVPRQANANGVMVNL
jgi:hypothetical protein